MSFSKMQSKHVSTKPIKTNLFFKCTNNTSLVNKNYKLNLYTYKLFPFKNWQFNINLSSFNIFKLTYLHFIYKKFMLTLFVNITKNCFTDLFIASNKSHSEKTLNRVLMLL